MKLLYENSQQLWVSQKSYIIDVWQGAGFASKISYEFIKQNYVPSKVSVI